CVNNLKQLAVATMLYAQDYDGYMQGSYMNNKCWFRVLCPTYIPNPRVFVCPSWSPYPNDISPTDFGNTNCYGMPSTKDLMIDIAEGKTVGTCRFTFDPGPSNFLLYTDSVYSVTRKQYYCFESSSAASTEKFVHLRHYGKAAAVFTDGSARMISQDDCIKWRAAYQED
ncbi:MAG: hypothetical protein PHT33_13855, partial [bacterium]|nr:hypothetical protein [bacterium]